MKRIIFFDGVCNLCNSFVDLLIKVDRKKRFHFAPLQGKTSEEFELEFSDLNEDKQSLVYIDFDKIKYKRSIAVIHILKDLLVFGRIFLIIKIIPVQFLDFIYSLVAKNRYRFFGKKTSCRIPTKEERLRFLE